MISVTADIENASGNTIVVAAKYGFAKLDRSTGKLEYLKRVWEEKDDIRKADKSAKMTIPYRALTDATSGCASTMVQWTVGVDSGLVQ